MTEQYLLLELKGSSSIAQLSGTACRKMLAFLDRLELSVFLLYCLAGVTERNTRALDSQARSQQGSIGSSEPPIPQIN